MYTDKILICKDCGAEFLFTAGEQEFYEQRGFSNEPVRCRKCRSAKRRPRREPKLIYEIVCSECGKTDDIDFEPRRDRPVYCRECFAKRYTRR